MCSPDLYVLMPEVFVIFELDNCFEVLSLDVGDFELLCKERSFLGRKVFKTERFHSVQLDELADPGIDLRIFLRLVADDELPFLEVVEALLDLFGVLLDVEVVGPKGMSYVEEKVTFVAFLTTMKVSRKE